LYPDETGSTFPPALARRLGSHLLTEATELRPELGFDSYDRLFRSQDTMPHGGFGNLIALPLRKASRGRGTAFRERRVGAGGSTNGPLLRASRSCAPKTSKGSWEAERRDRVLGVRLPAQEDGFDEPWSAPPSRRRTHAISAEGTGAHARQSGLRREDGPLNALVISTIVELSRQDSSV
jgi:hypothetical protein